MCKILSIFVVNCCLIFLGCRDLGNVYKVSGSNSVNENRTVANFSAASLPIDKTIQGKDTTPEYQTEIDLKSTDKIEFSVAAPKSKKTDFILGNRRSKLPSFIKGTWEIVKYVEIDGHAYEKPDLAQAEIGKKIILDKFKVKYDQNFLFFDDTCENVDYKFTKHPFKFGDKGSLWFYDLPEAQSKRAEDFIVRCNGSDRYYFDITRDKELSIYFDGWFFFLKKI